MSSSLLKSADATTLKAAEARIPLSTFADGRESIEEIYRLIRNEITVHFGEFARCGSTKELRRNQA